MNQERLDFQCIDAASLVCDSRDRALLESETQALQHHLSHCASCAVANQQFKALFAQLDDLLGKNRATSSGGA